MEVETTSESAQPPDLAELFRGCLASGIIVVDRDQTISGFNQTAEEILRFPKDVHRPSLDLLPSSLSEFITEVFEGKSDRLSKDIVIHQGDGSFAPVQASAVPCAARNGTVAQVVIVLNELSASEKLGWSMQRLERLASIGTLSASMAHEIKNALVAVTTFVDDLLERNKDAELAGLVRREIRRVDSIVSQMLKFAGPAKPTFSRISLHRILEQSLRLIHPQLESKDIRLRRSFSAQPDTIEGDGYQLEQVFINMLLNAVAAMEAGGRLSISTEFSPAPVAPSDHTAAEPSVHVVMTDTGTGIAPENLARLFEPFFTTKPQGTGLGLAISRRIILEHRGKISVETEFGKGTTFRIIFPVSSANMPA